MKTIRPNWLLAVAFLLAFSACSIDKRLYRPGYHVESGKSHAAPEKRTAPGNGTAHEATWSAGSEHGATELQPEPPAPALAAKATSLAASASGSPVAMKTPGATLESPVVGTADPEPAPVNAENKTGKKAKGKAAGGDGKSQLVALLLCIFLGVLGIHRFYLGYPGLGILMLLTGGLCGILALIDLILIITGSLKPKHGEYDETF